MDVRPAGDGLSLGPDGRLAGTAADDSIVRPRRTADLGCMDESPGPATDPGVLCVAGRIRRVRELSGDAGRDGEASEHRPQSHRVANPGAQHRVSGGCGEDQGTDAAYAAR